MKFEEYVSIKREKKVPADIQTRWKTRVVAGGLDKLGEEGARVYLDMYGKGIAAPKCILLAIHAENSGRPDMAIGFWKKAAQLEKVELTDIPNISGVGNSISPVVNGDGVEFIPEFPVEMQPGQIAPMQPIDAVYDREAYIKAPIYWGQPKKDGNKVLAFVTKDRVFYQSRTMKLRPSPSFELDNALTARAAEIGPFIVEGELYYLDCDGKEHRTAAQALTYNIAHDVDERPIIHYMSFTCLFVENEDMRDATYADRIAVNEDIFSGINDDRFYAAPTYRTEQEKRLLVNTQKAEGREGEIWFSKLLAYSPGKSSGEYFLRTKYLVEFDAVVKDRTPTTADGRLFGAIEICDPTGKPLGTIGTGFDRPTQAKIAGRFETARRDGTQMKVKVVAQGFTENGLAFLARLSEEYE